MPSNVTRSIDRFSIFLLLVLIVAGVLRGVTFNESLWTDELHTSWTAVDDLSDVGPRARIGNNSPTYFYAIWFLAQAFGHSEIVYRSLSWVAGLGLIIAVYFYAVRWTKSKVVALLVSALMTIDPNLIFYSAEARPYSLLQFCMFISAVHFFYYCMYGCQRSRLIWISTLILGFHFHYTSLLLLTGEMTFAGMVLAYRQRMKVSDHGFRMTTFVFDLSVLAVIIAFSSKHLFMVAGRRDNWAYFVHMADWTAIFDIFKTTRLVGIAALLLAVGLAFDKWGFKKRISTTEPNSERKAMRMLILYCACVFLVPAFSALMVNNLDIARLFFRRYLVSMIAPLYLLLAAIIALQSSKIRAVTALVVLAFAVSWSSPFQSLLLGKHQRHSAEDWRGAVAKINEVDQDSVVLLRTGLIEEVGNGSLFDEYKQFPVRAIYSLDSTHPCITLPLTTEAGAAFDLNSQSTPLGDAAWLLIRGRKTICDAVIQTIIDSTEASETGTLRADVIEEFRFGRNIHLIRLRIK